MEQLKIAWVHRFWIVTGIVAIAPIIAYFVDTSKLAQKAGQRKSELESTINDLKTKLKGPFPNEKWVAGVNVKTDELSGQVDGAWIDLYKRQEPIRTFPKEVEETFLEAGPKPTTPFPVQTLLKYQELFTAQLAEIVRSVEPVGIQNSKGLVQMSPDAIIGKYRPVWADRNYPVPPTVTQAWLAQEDVWILRAMMDVVRRANKDSKSWNESPVKRIIAVERGMGAEDSSAKKKEAQWSAPDYVDLAAESSDSQNSSARAYYRYLDKTRLYAPVPIFMYLQVDQRKMLQVLAEFANSDVPMEIRQVLISKASELPAFAVASNNVTGAGKSSVEKVQERGEAIRVEDEYFHMTDVQVWARAYLYLIPPKLEEERKAQAKAEVTESPVAQD